jgi:hypothetical protein
MYLGELDYFVKQDLKCKGYLRYCDDFCLFGGKDLLNDYKLKIINFLKDTLDLNMSKCDLFPVTHGVDFLGYRHFRDKILLRKSTSKRVKKRLHALPKELLNGYISDEQFVSVLASISGWVKHSNSYNFRRTFC